MNLVRTGSLLAVGLSLTVTAACHSSSSSAQASAEASKAQAFASSTAGQLAKTDAEKLFQGCTLPSGTNKASITAWETVLKCAQVPKGSRFKAAECTVKNVAAGKLPPKGQARDEYLINAAYPCAKQYQAKGSTS